MDLLPGSKVVVVDILETIRVEYRQRLIREVDKVNWSKKKRLIIRTGHSSLYQIQLNSETIPAVSVDKAVTSEIPERNKRQSDSEGYYHRSIRELVTLRSTTCVITLIRNGPENKS